MIVGVAGVPQDLALSRDYDAIFSQLQAAGISVYTPTSQYQENPVALTLGLESDFLPPPYGTADPSVYEAMRAHGITLVINADQLYNPNEPMPAPENDPLLALINAAGRDVIHAIYGYDEPAHQGVSVAASQALYEHVNSIDSTIPIIQIHRNLDETNPEHLTPEGMAEYLALVEAHAQWADIVGFDIYPIGLSRGAVTPYSNGLMVSPEQAVQDYMTWLQTELPDSQHALVLQAFNVLDLYSDELIAALDPEVIAALTPPTTEELASMLAAAHEADEIFWWGQSHITDAATSQLWQTVLAQTSSFLADFSDNDIVGTEAAETLTGTDSAERITGAGGDDILLGGGGDDTLVGGIGADEMIGGGGSDIYYFDNAGDSANEAGGDGVDVIRTSLAVFDLGSPLVQGEIENLVGTLAAGQVLTGNALNNVITGSWGNDTLSGGGGTDTLIGGAGNDTYIFDVLGAVVQEADDGGNDTIRTSLAVFSLQTAGLASSIENLTGVLASGQHLTGNALDNIITGAAGNDFLLGGGGNDTLRGGLGNDVYTITDMEIADEVGGAGIDTIETSLSGFDLKGPNVIGAIEGLTGTSDSGQFLIGNALSNTIIAGAGNDTLDGDAGADLLQGGLGDDLYLIDHSNDEIIENLTAGTDTVISTASYILSGNLERILLSGDLAINATGNASDNYIQGNAADNILSGGAGVDTMVGGDGNDIYVVDNAGDLVGESNADSATGGVDTVRSYVSSYALSANVENAQIVTNIAADLIGNNLNNLVVAGAGNNVLHGAGGVDTVSYANSTAGVSISLVVTSAQSTGGSGVDTLISIENLIGSSYNDRLFGNQQANTLNGGEGADWMSGGGGNDVFYVDHAGDVVFEVNSAAAGGTDIVLTYLSSYWLAANVENGQIMSANTANLYGNNLNNILFAGAGNNLMVGAGGVDTASYEYATGAVTISLGTTGAQATGGSGIDTLSGIENLVGSAFSDVLTGNGTANELSGGGGSDIFVFNTALGSTNIDTIFAYSAADDTIHLENTGVFSSLGLGTLNAGAFNTGTAATQADDRIIYNSATGALLYDADGTGSVAAVQFATISGLSGTITASDFFVV